MTLLSTIGQAFCNRVLRAPLLAAATLVFTMPEKMAFEIKRCARSSAGAPLPDA
ncbi:MAG: hypothetical protein WDN46_04000 [Methylocella sp.]